MKLKKLTAWIMAGTLMMSMAACGTENTGKTAKVEDRQIEVAEQEKDPDADKKAEVETSIQEFEYACQELDVDAMLDCLDSGFAQSMKSERVLLNWMSSKKDNDEIVMSTILLTLMSIDDITVDLSTMNISVRDITVNDDTATVEATWEMKCSSGKYRNDVEIHMSKSGDTWYITGIQA